MIVRLFPRAWRRKYGDEIGELLKGSGHPVRDRISLAVAAVEAHWFLASTSLRRSRRRLLAARGAALVMVAAGVFGLLSAQTELARGLREVPMHWWSSVPLVVLALGIVLGAITRRPKLERFPQPRS